jgi:hypothetical protein
MFDYVNRVGNATVNLQLALAKRQETQILLKFFPTLPTAQPNQTSDLRILVVLNSVPTA